MPIMYTPYTYLIGWSTENRYYYGVRFAKGCSPSDLWNTYFTSSKTVHECRERWGDPDIISVRRTFTDADSAIEWEKKVLRRAKVLETDKWLNSNIGGAIVLSAETRRQTHKKISTTLKKYYEDMPKADLIARSSKAGKALWSKPGMADHLSEKRREQSRNGKNPMQGKKQRRCSCIYCQKEIAVNGVKLHLKKCRA